jgi:hypothetical protein
MGTLDDPLEVEPVDVGVDLRRGHVGVTEQLLDHPEVGATLEEVGGEGVPERVRVGGDG